jgi:hypothetical protein
MSVEQKFIETWDRKKKRWVHKLLQGQEIADFYSTNQVIDLDQYNVDSDVLKGCVHQIQNKANQIKEELKGG